MPHAVRPWTRRCIAFLALAAWTSTASLESTSARFVAAPKGGAADLAWLTPPPTDLHRDFDGDGVLDATAVVAGNRVRVELSASHALVTLPSAERVVGLASVDIDHDGDLDLVAFLGSGRSMVWINDGHGAFAAADRHPTESAPLVMAQTWIASVPLAPLAIGAWHPVWLARPPSIVAPPRCLDRTVLEMSAPRSTLACPRRGRAPPLVSL